MGRLSELGLTMEDIDLGGIDAESDPKLDEYFLATPYVASALLGRRTLFLGRKGSGKSALFTQLPRLFKEAGGESGAETVLLTPDQYAWAALRAYEEQGILREHAHTNAWKLTLAIELAGHLASLDRRWSDPARRAAATLRAFLDQNYGDRNSTLAATATSLLKGLKKFNLSAFGFGAGFERESSEQQVTPAVVDALFENLHVLTREVSVTVALDRLDDSWDGSADSKSLIIGLLKAAKDINDSSRLDASKGGIRILVFLRSDIYDVLEFDDKDKHRPSEEDIRWETMELKEMLRRRLPDGLAVDDLFEPGDMRGSIQPFNYIAKRTFLRPREILQFMEEALRQAGPHASEITKDNIRAAEERYSGWKVKDVKQEYSKAFPGFDEALECLRQEVHRYDSLETLESLIQRKAPALLTRYGIREVLETLFNSSVIGVRLGDAGSARFKCEDSELALPASGAVYVHQSLHRGLKIRETRKVAEAADEARARRDEATIKLMNIMMKSESIRAMNYMHGDPTPRQVLESEDFSDCAQRAGVNLRVKGARQHEDAVGDEDYDDYDNFGDVTMSTDGTVSEARLRMDSRDFAILQTDMLAALTALGMTVADLPSDARGVS